MKTIWPLLVLSVSIISASAQVTEKVVKLIGVTAGFGEDVAIIEVRIPRRSPEGMILKAGQGQNGVQMLGIDAAAGTAKLMVDGEARTVVLEEDAVHPSTNRADQSSSPVIRFRSLPLQLAMDIYAKYKNRTIMRHPQLGEQTFSLNVSPGSKEEAATMFERMFNEQNIATIPDGEHLLMVVPFALTNAIKPRADRLAKTNSIVPELSVNFREAPLPLVLGAYADYVHKEVVNLHDNNVVPCCPLVTFVQTTPLSIDELCYALETQIEWRNLRLVPDGDKWKWQRITEPR